MKLFLILVGIVATLFIAIQIFTMRSQSDIETYPYIVVTRHDKVEVRDYEASLFTTVTMATKGYKEGSSKGFSVLAGYIFGGNERAEKIAMTSPVSMSLEDSMTMMFMVPRNLKIEQLPQPNQSQINFQEVPAKRMAAIRFGGWADDAKIAFYKEKLITTLVAQGVEHSNRFYFFGYNPPYEVLNRRNEVVVELSNP